MDRYGTLPGLLDISDAGESHSWCLQHVAAADVTECRDRLFLLFVIQSPDAEGDPCLSTA